MAYSDQKFITRVLVPARFGATSTLTATASGAVVTNTAQVALPKFIRRTKVAAIRIKQTTIPVASTVKLAFLNGTSTFAVATISGTAGQSLDATVTDTLATFAADGEPTVTVIGTGTASAAQVAGVYDIYFEQLEQF
jgi:hypothetical protein